MTDKEALKLALEALEPFGTPRWAGTGVDKANEAITAINQALAAPAQRPQNCGTGYCSCIECVVSHDEAKGRKDAYPLFIHPSANPKYRAVKTFHEGKPVYVAQPLTDVIKAAQGVLESTEIAHRPPLRDQLEVGRTARVRIHALADLHDALAARGIKEKV